LEAGFRFPSERGKKKGRRLRWRGRGEGFFPGRKRRGKGNELRPRRENPFGLPIKGERGGTADCHQKKRFYQKEEKRGKTGRLREKKDLRIV